MNSATYSWKKSILNVNRSGVNFPVVSDRLTLSREAIATSIPQTIPLLKQRAIAFSSSAIALIHAVQVRWLCLCASMYRLTQSDGQVPKLKNAIVSCDATK
jgi:hypothetical protein